MPTVNDVLLNTAWHDKHFQYLHNATILFSGVSINLTNRQSILIYSFYITFTLKH